MISGTTRAKRKHLPLLTDVPLYKLSIFHQDKFRFVAQIISHFQTYLNSNCLCPHLLHCLSACFCNQHPVNLFLHGFLCIFIEMIADNIYCLPDFLCKCVSFCFFIHHFFHNHLFPFFPVPDRERFASVPAGSLSAR